MTYQAGDRVRWITTGDDGLPLVRYGFVGGTDLVGGHAIVMFDDDLRTDTVVAIDDLDLVTVTTVELRLDGVDLLTDPSLRQGLVNLWSAEADEAGLEICSIHRLGTGVRNGVGEAFALAEISAGGRSYVLRATGHPDFDTVSVRADRPRRWEIS